MSGFEQLKNTFFDESSELLVELENGLNSIREGAGSDDTVHAIFRAVHSIKGGAGVFGFSELIDFAHAFETVLDAVRRGDLRPSPDVLDILFRANDTLADLVGMARSGNPVEAGFGSDCRAALEQLMQGEAAGEDAGAKRDEFGPAELEGVVFTPVRADGFDDGAGTAPAPADGAQRRYRIAFRPTAGLIRKDLDPLFFLNVLRSLGTLDLVADTARLPALAQLEPDQAYVGWSGTLDTTFPRSEIEAVFAPIRGDCEVEIVDLSAGADAGSAAAAAPLPPPPAPVVIPPEAAPSIQPDDRRAGAEIAEPAAAGEKPRTGSRPANTTIRVELEKIDRVVNMVGELVIAQAMLGQAIEGLPEEVGDRVSNILADLVRHTRGLKDSVMAIRAQPVSSVFQRMPRLVRELSTKTGKKVQVEMSGETTEVDKTIIERLSDPLTHIIRNSIDHGIETPADRLAAGKPEFGTIHLAADQRGGRIVIEISDDGRGINLERVLSKAREKGLVDPNATLSEDEICNLIFLPGFSTAETISDISGRGVGMDVVRRNIQDLGGRTSIKSEAGRGTTIQLALPLTLAVMDGMVVEVGQQTYVLPIPNIVECLRPTRDEIHQLLGTAGTLRLRGDIVPLVYLADMLGVTAQAKHASDGVVIITEASDGTRLGLIVDELCGHQQVVIKSIEENCGAVRGIAGATILGDGHVAFILDVEMLSDMSCHDGAYPGTHGKHFGIAPALSS